MKKIISQSLARPRLIYVYSLITVTFLGAFGIAAMYAGEAFGSNLAKAVLFLFGLLFGLLTWLSYVLESRRVAKKTREEISVRTRKEVQALVGDLRDEWSVSVREMQAEIERGRMRAVGEYEKQNYNLLVNLQQLRLAVLEEKESDLRDE